MLNKSLNIMKDLMRVGCRSAARKVSFQREKFKTSLKSTQKRSKVDFWAFARNTSANFRFAKCKHAAIQESISSPAWLFRNVALEFHILFIISRIIRFSDAVRNWEALRKRPRTPPTTDYVIANSLSNLCLFIVIWSLLLFSVNYLPLTAVKVYLGKLSGAKWDK